MLFKKNIIIDDSMDVEVDIDRNSDLLIVTDLNAGKTKDILACRISIY